MGALLATALVIAFWALLWAGAAWASPDTRDGADWAARRPITGRPERIGD